MIRPYTYTVHELKRLMNEELESVNEWVRINRFKVNVKKTKYLEIGTPTSEQSISVIMDGEIVESVKYLAVLIGCKLNFRENLSHEYKKVARKFCALARLSNV